MRAGGFSGVAKLTRDRPLKLEFTVDGAQERAARLRFDRARGWIGRSSRCGDLQLRSKGVSKLHLRLFADGGGPGVVDNRSSNGTWITAPARRRERMVPRMEYPLEEGTLLNLAGVVELKVTECASTSTGTTSTTETDDVDLLVRKHNLTAWALALPERESGAKRPATTAEMSDFLSRWLDHSVGVRRAQRMVQLLGDALGIDRVGPWDEGHHSRRLAIWDALRDRNPAYFTAQSDPLVTRREANE
jgi:hypothetical protein